MRYIGSKRLVAKHILPIILRDRSPGQWYVEPFVGGGNIFELVEGPKLGCDACPHVISALKLIRDEPLSLPKKASQISQELYLRFKATPSNKFHGYIGFACSFGGKYYGGRIKEQYPGDEYDRVSSQYRTAQKTSIGLQGAKLQCKPFDALDFGATKTIIYCDPPYEGTTGYATGSFNHKKFWQWCRAKVADGHKVFISEYHAPEDFIPVWERGHRVTLNTKNQKSVEKLFVYRRQLNE